MGRKRKNKRTSKNKQNGNAKLNKSVLCSCGYTKLSEGGVIGDMGSRPECGVFIYEKPVPNGVHKW